MSLRLPVLLAMQDVVIRGEAAAAVWARVMKEPEVEAQCEAKVTDGAILAHTEVCTSQD